MMNDPLDRLIRALSRLPAVGRRSAERMARGLVQDRKGLTHELIEALKEADERLRACSQCGSITMSDAGLCSFCTDPGRDESLLCVVENPGDIMLIERAGGYRGRYHALMGRLSPMRENGVRDLRFAALLKRIQTGGVREVILALNSNMESDATASFLRDALAQLDVQVTRIAFGIPAGSGIAYSDPITLARAMDGRRKM